MDRPFSQACENNKQPILDGLRSLLKQQGALLEIGSGTGQHAAFLAPRLQHIQWQPSDLPDALPGICQWLDDSRPANARQPIALDVNGRWPDGPWQYVFTANTFHIMAEQSVERCIVEACQRLTPGGLFVVYGPFLREDVATSESNLAFDGWLRQRDPRSGLRRLDWINSMMGALGMAPIADLAMPANNSLLAWQK